MKIISFTFLNKTTFKDKTCIMTSSSRFLPKPKTTKKWKEKWNWLQFSERKKDVLCCLQETPRKTEKDVWLH